MMSAWQAEADAFCLPEDVQKGLIFLIALGLRVDVPTEDKVEWLRYTQKLSRKIRLESPHIPEGEGGNFYDGKIEELLSEFIHGVDKDFSPRELELNGQVYCWWKRPTESKLPRCLDTEMWSLRDWEEVMISLCRQIGEYIDMDLEGAYLAGFNFFDSYVYFDTQATLQVVQTVTTLPPQLSWFRMMLDLEPGEIVKWGPVSKIMDAFACGNMEYTEKVYLAAHNYPRFMMEASGKSMWDCRIEEFAEEAIRIRPYGEVDISRERWVEKTNRHFRSEGWSTPPRCQSKEDVLRTVYGVMEKAWGFDCLHEDQSEMFRGSQLLRKCAFVYSCAVLTALDPKWNPLVSGGLSSHPNESESSTTLQDKLRKMFRMGGRKSLN